VEKNSTMTNLTLNIFLCQLNPIVGNIEHNRLKAQDACAQAFRQGADLVVFSELYICGYPPEDLILNPSFQRACRDAVSALARITLNGPAIIIGSPWMHEGGLYNAVVLLENGKIADVRFKVELPNYGVFDEKRLFNAGALPEPLMVRGISIGVPICEDIWKPDVVRHLASAGAELLIVPNASPYWRGKSHHRTEIARQRVQETGLPMIYVNQVGGQDELVFDGASFVLDKDGKQVQLYESFAEQIEIIRWKKTKNGWECPADRAITREADDDGADYQACVLGLRDYVEKNRFPGVMLGLSGGVDSALVAAMAVDAVGAKRVQAVILPYIYTSPDSLIDAAACARALGVHYDILSINAAVEGLENVLLPLGKPKGVTAENLQSRARGTLLMALSNTTGNMVLTTGNKSEVAVGYCTLYGDMNGGFNPIKDIYKTEVYRLCALRNRWKPRGALGPDGDVIPARILTKAPSAELRPDQTDQDNLPPYDVLDGILNALVECDLGIAETVALGYDEPTVRRVECLLKSAEYKRRQSAPGVKITRRQFGRDRRYPITNGF
jgi:NAD+ synthase